MELSVSNAYASGIALVRVFFAVRAADEASLLVQK